MKKRPAHLPTMSRRSCLRRLGATKLYLNSRSWDGAAHGIGQWSMEEEHPVRSHRWPRRSPPLPCLFLSRPRIFAKHVSSVLSCHATFHRANTRFYYPSSFHETIRRYVFNESRSIVRDCSVRLACGPNVGEEAHLPRSPSRGETYERKMGATRSVKRERERPYSYDACHGRERVSAREC